MVNPRDHRVVVIESLLCPTHFRNTLARVLFNHLSVSNNIKSAVVVFVEDELCCQCVFDVKLCGHAV